MTLTLSPWSIVSLCHMCATLLTVTCSHSHIELFVALGLWVRMLLLSMGAGYAVVRGHWSFDSSCWWSSLLLGGRCHLLGAGCHLPLAAFVAYGCQLGSCHILGSCITHPWPLTNHDSHLPMKQDNHTPTSPASTTMHAPSTSSAAMSRNPTTNKHSHPTYNDPPIDNCMQKRQRVANDTQHPTNDTETSTLDPEITPQEHSTSSLFSSKFCYIFPQSFI